MKLLSAKRFLIFFTFAVIIFSFVFIFQTSLPLNDSGVYLYIGNTIVHGQMPYAFAWDHKPPAVFYINALGLFLTPNSILGVRIIEFVLLSATVVLVFNLLRKNFGIFTALLTIAGYFCSLLAMLDAGNSTEEFSLLPQTVALFLFVKFEQKNSSSKKYLILGFLWGINVLLKESLIGVFVAILLYLLVKAVWERDYKNFFVKVIFIFSGLFLILSAVLTYFWAKGNLSNLYDAFLFNFYYIQTLKDSHLGSLGAGALLTGGLFAGACIGWLLSIKNIFKFSAKNILLTLCIFELPVEIALSIISGRLLWHYFLPWLLPSVVLTAVAINTISNKIKKLTESKNLNKITANMIVLSLFLLYVALCLLPLFYLIRDLRVSRSWLATNQQAIFYLLKHTRPGDYVLIWGGEPEIYFLTQTISPTRYIATSHLFIQSPFSQKMATGFLKDLKRNKPKIILDISSEKDDILAINKNAFKGKRYYKLYASPQIVEILKYIRINYTTVRDIGDKNWIVYEAVK